MEALDAQLEAIQPDISKYLKKRKVFELIQVFAKICLGSKT